MLSLTLASMGCDRSTISLQLPGRCDLGRIQNWLICRGRYMSTILAWRQHVVSGTLTSVRCGNRSPPENYLQCYSGYNGHTPHQDGFWATAATPAPLGVCLSSQDLEKGAVGSVEFADLAPSSLASIHICLLLIRTPFVNSVVSKIIVYDIMRSAPLLHTCNSMHFRNRHIKPALITSLSNHLDQSLH